MGGVFARRASETPPGGGPEDVACGFRHPRDFPLPASLPACGACAAPRACGPPKAGAPDAAQGSAHRLVTRFGVPPGVFHYGVEHQGHRLGLCRLRRREGALAAVRAFGGQLAAWATPSLLMSHRAVSSARFPVVAINYCTVKCSLWIKVTWGYYGSADGSGTVGRSLSATPLARWFMMVWIWARCGTHE